MKHSEFTREEVNKTSNIDKRLIDIDVDDGTDGGLTSAIRSSRFSTAHAVLEELMVGSRSESNRLSSDSPTTPDTPRTPLQAVSRSSPMSVDATDPDVLEVQDNTISRPNGEDCSSSYLTLGSTDTEALSSPGEEDEQLTEISLRAAGMTAESHSDAKANISEKEKTAQPVPIAKPEDPEPTPLEPVSGTQSQSTPGPQRPEKVAESDLDTKNSNAATICANVNVRAAVAKLERKIHSEDGVERLPANEITVSSVTKSMRSKSVLIIDPQEKSSESTNDFADRVYANSEANEDSGLSNVPLQEYPASYSGDFTSGREYGRFRRRFRGIKSFLQSKPSLPKRWSLSGLFDRRSRRQATTSPDDPAPTQEDGNRLTFVPDHEIITRACLD